MWEGYWGHRLHWGPTVLPVMTVLLVYGMSVSPHSVHAYIKGNGEKTRVQAHKNPEAELRNSSKDSHNTSPVFAACSSISGQQCCLGLGSSHCREWVCTGLAVTPGHKGLCVIFVASESLHGGAHLEGLGPVLLVRVTFQREPRGY